MHSAWADGLQRQCEDAGVPFLFKQWGSWAPVDQIDNSLHARRKADVVDSKVGTITMVNVGKKNAGRLLNGLEYSQFPIASCSNDYRQPSGAI